ncbi:SPRY domain-containing protein [Aphelenchoides bicaudatus]|nr:SPRY domain-containing protein [Aphelenchoides bicaudatus]
MIRTDKVPLAALLAGEPIKPLSRKVIEEQEAAQKAMEEARKEKSATRVHKFDLEEETNETVLKKSKHHKEHKEHVSQRSHKSVVSTKTTTAIASTSTYIISQTNDHLPKRKSSHETKDKAPLIMPRKHSDQRDKSSSLQKRPEQKKSFDSTKSKLTIRTDKPSPSGDPFKKPRPVQPSPVQRSPAIAKPSSSGGLGVFDLLDSIMEKQDRTMQELNKSEEQKANERQRLEMERRRKSAENPFEKGAAFSSGSNLPVNQPLSVNVKTDGSQQSTPSDTAGSINTPRESRTSQEKSPKTLPKERTSKSESTEKSPVGTADKQPQQTTPKERPPIDFTEEAQPVLTEPVKIVDQTIQVTQTTIVELSLDDIPLPDEIPSNQMETSTEAANVEDSPKESVSNEMLSTQTVSVVTTQETTIQVETISIGTEREDVKQETNESLSTVEDEEVRPYEPEMLPGVEVDDSMNDAELIASANLILKNLQQSANDSTSGINITYEQVVISDDESTNSAKDPEEKPPMDFYGEPVPDSDDEDDKLFEMAAGMPKSKKGEVKKIEEEALPNNETIELDYYNADINIKSDIKNKWSIDPDNGDGFALMWGCVRSNYGLCLPNNVSDRSSLPPYIVYQVQIKDYLPIKHLPFEELEPYEVRLGWSADSVRSIVGESQNSYAYCSTGRKAAGNIFSDFGQNAQILDYITVVLDLLNNELRIFLNDTDLGAAHTNLRFNSPGSTDNQTIVFPHIGLKNMRCLVNFGVEQADPDSVTQWPVPGFLADKPYKFFGELNRFPNNIVATPRPPPSKSDCTVIFMVGLPASGKSKWVEQYLREHENERWIVLNSDAMLNLMKVNGVPRKRVHQGRWDAVMGLAAKGC